MKANRFSSLLIILFIVSVLLLTLIISLQMTILADREFVFGDMRDDGSQAQSQVLSSAPTNTPQATRIFPAIARVTRVPTEEAQEEAALPMATDAPVATALTQGATAVPVEEPREESNEATTLDSTSTIRNMAVASAAFAQAPSAAELRMVRAPRTTASADENVLVDMVAENRFAVGVVGYATLAEAQGRVRGVPLTPANGYEATIPDFATMAGGRYPLSYSLYLYTSQQILQSNPQVVAYLGCYLNRAFTDAELAGLFPLDITDYTMVMGSYTQQTGLSPTCNTGEFADTDMRIAAANALLPLTNRVDSAFGSGAFDGEAQIQVGAPGRTVQRLCQENRQNGAVELIAVDRALYAEELAACQRAGHDLISFEIARDALVVIASQDNAFLAQTDLAQLQAILTGDAPWATLQADWPNEPIIRAIPGEQTSAFANLVQALFHEYVRPPSTLDTPDAPADEPVLPDNATELVDASATDNAELADTMPEGESPGSSVTASSGVGTGGADASETDASETDAWVIAGVEGRTECTTMAGVVAQVLEFDFGQTVVQVTARDTDELYNWLAWESGDGAEEVHFSPCYTDLDDRPYLAEKGSTIALMHSTYGQIGNDRLYIVAHSGVPSRLREASECVYKFLGRIRIENEDALREQSATEWLEENSDLVDEWTSCLP